MKRIGRRGIKREVQIEITRSSVLGMYLQCANAGDLSSVQRSQHRVLEQRGANAFTLTVPAYRESCQCHEWDGMTRETLFKARGRVVVRNVSHDERVVTDDASFICRDISLRRVRKLALVCVLG